MQSRSFLLVGLLMSLSVACRREAALVPVVGTVTYQGQPLTYGSIMFQPIGSESGTTARSPISSDGTFALQSNAGAGVAIGKARVRVTAFEAQRAQQEGQTHQELALGKSAIPRKYQNFGTSGIVIDVQPNMDLPLQIDLESK